MNAVVLPDPLTAERDVEDAREYLAMAAALPARAVDGPLAVRPGDNTLTVVEIKRYAAIPRDLLAGLDWQTVERAAPCSDRGSARKPTGSTDWPSQTISPCLANKLSQPTLGQSS